jgi:hypothetical protein
MGSGEEEGANYGKEKLNVFANILQTQSFVCWYYKPIKAANDITLLF